MSSKLCPALLALLPLLYLATPVQAAPSFLCTGKLSPVETAICTDPLLAEADMQLAARYRAALEADPASKAALGNAQRAWLKSRNQACSSEGLNACLLKQYQQRLAELRAAPEEESGANDYAIRLRTGGTVYFNQVLLTCNADSVQLAFPDPNLPMSILANTLQGRGTLSTAWADCPLASGQTIRVKTGNGSPAQAYGRCGAAPETRLSVWVDQRKAIAGLAYAETCNEPLLKTMTLRPDGTDYCVLPSAADSSLLNDAPGQAGNDGCKHIRFSSDAPIDQDEYPTQGSAQPVLGSLSLISSNAQLKPLCERLVAANTRYPLNVPAEVKTPVWQALKVPKPNEGDDVTLSTRGEVEQARFDLDNSGQVGTVYRLEQDNHYFDGSVLAREQPGILTTPFDPHAPDEARAKGVLAFVYQHALVLFEGGKTYLLLDPANRAKDILLVKPTAEGTEEVCVMRRLGETF
ncbi:lysozyme inhibitor LprI family protein [Pseudomonas sp. GV071]|uniref:lysozyme inhibitor LprI family protein n=1 Tax=Pseudomonas sp. GV071 TaxID=2135754 RepID=UPI000D43132F|nr:lysozyme inhibitor LprI family protein [Pseudomonas sp. GV071]PTQ67280.1 uncharacterized protein DUF1311 [Pseudomonas sp. GV071]